MAYLNSVYKKGIFNKIDLSIAKDLISFGDAFEYIYLDENNNIQSKVIRNKDSYSIYPDKVEIYENHNLIDSKIKLTGLRIYGNVKTDDHDHFVVPLNDGVGKPSGHEFGDRKKKF